MMSFIKKVILKYKWKLFWIFRKISAAVKHLNNVSLLHRISFVDIINKLDVKKILEIGCGNGANIWLLQENLNNTSISFYGIDISSAAVETAKSRNYKFPNNVFFEKNGGLSYLIKSSLTYDVILFDAVLMYMTEKEVLKLILRASGFTKYIIMHELTTHSKQSELNNNGFIHNYDMLLSKVPNQNYYKIKSKRIENIWGICGYTYVINFNKEINS
jgi:SAM-dependent methyltransferase